MHFLSLYQMCPVAWTHHPTKPSGVSAVGPIPKQLASGYIQGVNYSEDNLLVGHSRLLIPSAPRGLGDRRPCEVRRSA